MPLMSALLAWTVLQASASPPPSAPSMVVTEAQFASALPICRDQLAKPHFAEGDLAAAGWPKAMSAASDGASPSMVTYRHPENMLLLTLIDYADKADQCVIMVPFGPKFDPAAAVAAISAFAGKKINRAGGWPMWQAPAFDVRLDPMATAGARITFTKKGS